MGGDLGHLGRCADCARAPRPADRPQPVNLADVALFGSGCVFIACAVGAVVLARCRHRTWYRSGYLIVCAGCGKTQERTGC
jgi:hypothetical protein